MGRKLALLPVLVALLSSPIGAYALGLGNIKMRSALEQPLEAEIDLQGARSSDLEGLQVMLAPEQLFRSSSVERVPFLSNLRFSIAKKGDGTPYIRITSTQSVREPFLNFLVEATWASGRVVRQYTVLVDPPTSTQETAPAIEAPRAPAAVRSAPVAPKAAVSAQRQEPAPARQTSAVRSGEIVSRMTKRNDTLWVIANEVRPNRDVTTQQVMHALHRENPEAFYKNNMNRLKAGYVLRIKDAASITSVSRSSADAEFNRQYAEWRGVKPVKAQPKPAVKTSAKEVADRKSTSSPAAVAPVAKSQLKLLGSTGQAGATDNAAGKSGEIGKLQQDVALTSESLVAHQKESEEMRQRIAALETKIANMQKTISVKDQQLATMQGQAKPETTAAEEDLMSNPMVLGMGGLIAVLLGAFGWLFMQRRRSNASQESILSPAPVMQSSPSLVTNVPVSSAAAVATVGAKGAAAQEKEESAAGDSSFLTDFSVSSMEGIQTDVGEIDPMSEADVYLAYGRYNQAEEIMAQAIANDPARNDYKLKMCEIHYAGKDPQRFLRAAETMRNALGGATGSMWERVAGMGRELCPDSPLFGVGGAAASGLMGNVAQAAEIENEYDSVGEDTIIQSSPKGDFGDFDAAAKELGMSLNFGQTQPAEAESPAYAEPSSSTDNSLDFDVGDWMSKSTAAPADEEVARKKLEDDLAANSLSFDSLAFGATSPTNLPSDIADEEIVLHAPEQGQGDLDDEFFKGLDDDLKAVDEQAEFKPTAVKGINDFDFNELFKPDADQALNIDDRDTLHEDHLFANIDEVGTKLDLARAYIDMGDAEGARSLLDEIMLEGNDVQRGEARELINKIG